MKIKEKPLDVTQSSLHRAQSKKDQRDPRMLEAAQNFENQFIRQMISEMRKTVPGNELVPEGMGERIFREELDNKYADSWVERGGIGLADIIYDQLQDKYGNAATLPRKSPGEALRLPPGGSAQNDRPRDILRKSDGSLFMAKASEGGYVLKSVEPLPERVDLHSPYPGIVLQSAALEDGRQMVVVKHDQGLVTQMVHSGNNRVKNGQRVDAGSVIAELPASQRGEGAQVFFGLRREQKTE
ncbi:MAG: rod-binding protein [Oligoflexia bacterium]|nr:rod-binding protein [Oligoflexia bacterium]